MKKSANAALAINRFDRPREMRGPNIPAKSKDRTKSGLTACKGNEKPGKSDRASYVLFRYSPEQIKDMMWLLAAIVVISILHRYLPNSGLPPHSIVDVVKSAEIFP